MKTTWNNQLECSSPWIFHHICYGKSEAKFFMGQHVSAQDTPLLSSHAPAKKSGASTREYPYPALTSLVDTGHLLNVPQSKWSEKQLHFRSLTLSDAWYCIKVLIHNSHEVSGTKQYKCKNSRNRSLLSILLNPINRNATENCYFNIQYSW